MTTPSATRSDAKSAPVLWCIGCGDLGTSIGTELVAEGWQVFGVRRHPPAQTPFPQVAIDVLANPQALRTLPAPDFVVYTVTPPQRTEEAYRAVYDTAVQAVLKELPATLSRFLLVSSTGVYAQQQGEWLDENSPAQPAGFSGQALLAGEQHVFAGGLPATVVRLSGIYGPGRHRLIERARSGAPVVQNPPAWTNRIHRDDAAGFLAHLLRRSHAGASLHALYLGTDDEPVTEWDVMCFIHHALDLPPPMPVTGGEDQNKRLRNDRLQQSGYKLRFPTFREGYGDMIRRLS